MVIFFIIFFGLAPSFIWLFFFLKEDIHPEPKKMIFKVFIAGVLIALAAALFQLFLQKVLGFLSIDKYSLISFLIFAAAEEWFKFFAVYLTIRKSKFFDEPIDAMIYMITAAMGFAAMENVFVVLTGILGQGKGMEEIFAIIIFRFLGATLLHALSSGIVGYYWGRSLVKKEGRLSIVNGQLLIFGLIFASLLHTIFNYSILIFRETLIYSTLFLIIVALFVFWDFEKIKRNTNIH